MRILTNMRFWQSRTWTESVVSIYPHHRLPLGRRPLSALREALELCRRSRDFDVVVTMGARKSLIYGLLCAIRGRPSRQIACEIFVDDPAPGNPLWRLKNALYGLVLRRAVGVLTNSTAEIETAIRRFKLARERVCYVPLHTNIMQPAATEQDDGFILSAGATRRDYSTLINAAASLASPVILVCPRDYPLPTPLPANVTVRRAIPRHDYLDLLRRCSFAVVPLHPTERATGQVVILEAMANAKPVIATRTAGALDLIRDGANGLLVPPYDSGAMAAAIQRLARDADLRRRLGQAALSDVLDNHTIETHAIRKLAAIRQLHERYGAAGLSTTR